MHLKNIEKKNDLTIMKDHDLLTRFSWVVQKEREATVTVICYLSEIERRKLYLKEAYSSLFSFVTRKFHYSEGAAYRRIQASKVSQLYPEVLGLLSQGKVSLMTVSLIEPHLTKERGKELIEKIIGKSKREVEFMLSELSLKKESHRDIIRRLPVFNVSPFLLPSGGSETAQNHTITGESSRGFTSESGGERDGGISTGEALATHPHPSPHKESAAPSVRKIKVEFVAKEELAQKIERAKEILRHKFPEGRFEDIFNQALEDMLEKRDPQRKIERVNKKSEKVSKNGEKMKREDKNNGTKEVGGEKEREAVRKDEKDARGGMPPSRRHIPEQVRRKVFERDGGLCSYESRDGRRCGERNFLQIDHVQPFALQGESSEENLRLLCARHNKWRSEKTFGKWG